MITYKKTSKFKPFKSTIKQLFASRQSISPLKIFFEQNIKLSGDHMPTSYL